MVWLGHILRSPGRCLERQAVRRYNELRLRGYVDLEGDILMDAPAHNNNDQLVGLSSGSDSETEREVARKQWKEWCSRLLSDADKDRKKNMHKPKAEDAVPTTRRDSSRT